MDWGLQDVFKVIALYKQFPCLWDYKSPEYKRVDLKKNAWGEISKNMGKDEADVKKKILNLRGAYVSKKKVAEPKKSGTSTDDVYHPHLFYFEELSFLENFVVLRKITTNLSENVHTSDLIEFRPSLQCSSHLEDSQESVSDTSHIDVTPSSCGKFNQAKKARIERDKKFNSTLDSILKSATEQETIYSAFAKSVELQLSQLPLTLAINAMAELQQLLANLFKKGNQNDLLHTALTDANIL